jgi:phage antirepressor YoqD-like protein
MTQIVIVGNPAGSVQTMTSLQIVDMINEERKGIEKLTGKAQKVLSHKNFMAKTRDVLGEVSSAKFLADDKYDIGKGAVGTRDIYVFPKREATLMAMSYSPAISAAVYDRMTELEEAQPKALMIPTTFAEALRLAADKAEEAERALMLVQEKETLLLEQAPKVEFVDEFVDAQGALGIQAASRLLRMNMRELGHWLVDDKLCFRRPPANTLVPYSSKIDQGLFVVKTGLRPGSEGPHAFEQMMITTKGLTYIAENAPKYVRK